MLSPAELLVISVLAGGVTRIWLKKTWRNAAIALFLAGSVVPAACVYSIFFVPYQGGGNPMWLIAIVAGGFYGLCAGAAAIAVVDLLRWWVPR